jgi:hypothetical protein
MYLPQGKKVSRKRVANWKTRRAALSSDDSVMHSRLSAANELQDIEKHGLNTVLCTLSSCNVHSTQFSTLASLEENIQEQRIGMRETARHT